VHYLGLHGTPLHGVGNQPDIPVERTIEGVAAIIDEALDAAFLLLAFG
jgi:hypothetical protein